MKRHEPNAWTKKNRPGTNARAFALACTPMLFIFLLALPSARAEGENTVLRPPGTILVPAIPGPEMMARSRAMNSEIDPGRCPLCRSAHRRPPGRPAFLARLCDLPDPSG